MNSVNIEWDVVNPECDPDEENARQVVRKCRKRIKIKVDTADFYNLTIEEPSAVHSTVRTLKLNIEEEPTCEEDLSLEDELSKPYTHRKSSRIKWTCLTFLTLLLKTKVMIKLSYLDLN